MLTKAQATEELAGTTAGERGKKSGGSEERAEVASGGGNRKGRRVMRCGDWIRLGDAAEEVVHSAASRKEEAGRAE